MKLRDLLPRIETIYGKDGVHETPYLTRFIWGSLRIHKFHRGDADPDCHDHQWDFHTFPLNKWGYYEEVLEDYTDSDGHRRSGRIINYVPGRTWTFVRAEHRHRVLGGAQRHRLEEYAFPIWTVVWTGPIIKPEWGFWKLNDDRKRLAFIHWKDYVYGDGASRVEHEWALQDQAEQEAAASESGTREVAGEAGAPSKPARKKRQAAKASDPDRSKRKYTRRKKTED